MSGKVTDTLPSGLRGQQLKQPADFPSLLLQRSVVVGSQANMSSTHRISNVTTTEPFHICQSGTESNGLPRECAFGMGYVFVRSEGGAVW